MKYIIRWFETNPVPMMRIFARSPDLEALIRLDFEKTQIIDTETGEIISNFGERSEEYGQWS